MKSMLLIATLVLLAGCARLFPEKQPRSIPPPSAEAQWTKVSENEKYLSYADKATMRQSGDSIRVWRLTDFKAPEMSDGKSGSSAKQQTEFDCTNERYRGLDFILYAGRGGEGAVVYSNTEPGSNWRPVSPDTQIAEVWKFVCGKR